MKTQGAQVGSASPATADGAAPRVEVRVEPTDWPSAGALARLMLQTGRAVQIRRAAGLSQEALAARLGVSQATIVHWETGANTPQHKPTVHLLGEILLGLAEELRMEAP